MQGNSGDLKLKFESRNANYFNKWHNMASGRKGQVPTVCATLCRAESYMSISGQLSKPPRGPIIFVYFCPLSNKRQNNFRDDSWGRLTYPRVTGSCQLGVGTWD